MQKYIVSELQTIDYTILLGIRNWNTFCYVLLSPFIYDSDNLKYRIYQTKCNASEGYIYTLYKLIHDLCNISN